MFVSVFCFLRLYFGAKSLIDRRKRCSHRHFFFVEAMRATRRRGRSPCRREWVAVCCSLLLLFRMGQVLKLRFFLVFSVIFLHFGARPIPAFFCIFCRQTLINNPQDFFVTVAKKSLHFTRHLHRPVLGIFW